MGFFLVSFDFIVFIDIVIKGTGDLKISLIKLDKTEL